METIWFLFVGFIFAGYVLLDGYDLGTGALHLFLARTDEERQQSLAAIAPFWDANEVWLIAGGGTLYFAFPPVYASGFSGFYLPLMMILWLLILRGISIDFRNHVKSPVWAPLWDAGFTFSSALLALFFGVALGNLLRGVPLDKEGEFFLPLWTNFRTTGSGVGILDWYTVLTGLFILIAIMAHGAIWVQYKTEGALSERARNAALRLIPVAGVLCAGVTWATFWIQPQAAANLRVAPWGGLLPLVGLTALVWSWVSVRSQRALVAFGMTSLFLLCTLAAAAFTLFPYLLPSNLSPEAGLTIYNSNPGPYGMRVGLYWWIPGMLIAVAYSVGVHRHFRGKVELSSVHA
ncbi:MAG: cytochrome d ubiquinol oxidase subunit II [Bryobacteraceae bacterium]